jgi:hypothetical protein
MGGKSAAHCVAVCFGLVTLSMIPKSGYRLSEKIMLQQ